MTREIYENYDAVGQVKSEVEGQEYWEIERVEYGNGLKTYVKGADFPMLGYATTEALVGINHCKKVLLELIRVIMLPSIMFGVLFTNKKRFVNRILASYMKILWGFISPYIIKEEYLMPISQEISYGMLIFLNELGIKDEYPDLNGSRFAKITAHIIEYDSAYRFRIMDLATETTKEKLLKNPITEIKRLIKVQNERDEERVGKNFKMVGMGITFALLIPKFRKAFRKTLESIDFEKFKYTDNERYWICLKPKVAEHRDYKWLGMTWEERQELFKSKNWNRPISHK